MSILTTRFQLIEIPVGTVGMGVGSRLRIPDQPQLRTQTGQVIIIQALRSYDVNTNAFTPSGAAVVNETEMGNSYLVLNVFGTDTNLFIPMSDLINQATTDTSVQRSYNNMLWRFNNITKVDWSKSYLQFGNTIGANKSFMIGVWYYVVPDDNSQTSPTPLEMPIVS